MAITCRFEVKAIHVVLGLALFSCLANGVALRHRRDLVEDTGGSLTVFDVTQFGAKADDKTDNAIAFIKAWKEACNSKTPAKVLIPKGNFVMGPAVFQGPCQSKVTFELLGIVKATTDLSDYSSPEWISFERITGLTLKGDGTFDGQGESAWKYNDCANTGDCAALPDQLKFFNVKDSDVSGITSLNSKYFHYHVVSCSNVNFHDLKITAPGESPNTDGMHISKSSSIKVINSIIGTGDDCISIGQGTNDLTVNKVTCGPGHGISVGSLGKYQNEEDVTGIVVTDCTFTGTTNGARIKTYPGSQASKASTIIFEDITMKDVKNPIVIDQFYGSKSSQALKRGLESSQPHVRMQKLQPLEN
ncbi:exopolygalacturonase clone GBGE184 isoform X2 [Ricinus communis]|uniref:exopolygalacturonase clone GBGE184 isoform X2 n=1 Tax=Ricinus communis TaxID=3988 RepID=UPI00201B2792|nr:exopolygalacturonase clone GBGE184 isoform X2 [Ricinus communis]